jgi:hypothetical protein
MKARRLALVIGSIGAVVAGISIAGTSMSACSKPMKYSATVEVVQAQVFGGDTQAAPSVMDLDLVFTECPGRQRDIIRGDKAFATCARKFKKGDKLSVDLVTTWRPDRGEYRSEIVKVGDCDRVVDPRDEASYEVVQQCTDLVINGVVMGVHCDKTRNAALIARCPWFRRK